MKKLLPTLFSILLLVGCSKDEKKFQDENENKQPEIIEEYDPGDGSLIAKDVKIAVESATASEHQNGTPVENTIDGDYTTNYHSLWNQSKFPEVPVELEYIFAEDAKQIDYVVLRPRQSGPNGIILEAQILIKSKGESEYTLYDNFEFKQSHTPTIIRFPEGFKKPSAFKIVVTKGANNFVSLGEIEFFHKISLDAVLAFFKDKACTELKPEVTREELAAIENEFIRNMALAIFDGSYDPLRIATFESYPNPTIQADANKHSPYGIYDNVTGMYIPPNTEMVVFVSDFEGNISLRIVDHTTGFGGTDYILQPGINRFTNTEGGLAYLIYQDQQKQEVKVNFATGFVNGYFDITKHTNADWDKLLNNTQYSFFDVLGEYSHLTFTTQAFKQYTSDAERLVQLYDSIVLLEQQFIGLYKYDRVNPTRMYFRVNTHQDMYMFATSYRTEYSEGTMPTVADPEKLRTTVWGPAHEVGHMNQTRPGLKWLGMTEVTNNILSLYVQTTFDDESRIAAEDLGRYNNRYEKAFSEMIAEEIPHIAHGDVFCQLVPFWQLQLYLANVKGNEDFYKDVYEVIRNKETVWDPGQNQVNFVKICSDVAQLDLTDFFAAWGFLSTVDKTEEDYGSGQFLVTQSMINEARSYVSSKGYPKPDAALQYITDKNIQVYKNASSSISPGTATVSGNSVNINGSQNVAVYQHERAGDVLFISSKTSFNVNAFMSGDKLYAVGYNGEREQVAVN